MNSTACFSPVKASSIDVHDTTYLLSPVQEFPDDVLRESIRTFGILCPPLLQEKERGRFIIASGRKRIMAALEVLDADAILCRLVPPGSPAPAVYAILLEHSLTGGEMSIAQQIAFFDGLLQTCSMDDAQPLWARLGHRPGRNGLAELLSLKALARPALVALHRGILSFNSARKTVRLAPGDQQTLVDIITRLQLGGSKQQKLIELCTELIMRRKEDLQTILQPFFSREESGQPENIPQRSAALLQWLHNENFPSSDAAEREFARFVQQLGLPPNAEVRHTPAFEDDAVTLCLRFPDPESMRTSWVRLQEIMG